MMNKFKRVSNHEWLGGVCGGVAYSFRVPTWVIRLVFTVFVLFYGVGFVPYILLWIFAPSWGKDPDDYELVTGS